MNNLNKKAFQSIKAIALTSLLAISTSVFSATLPSLVDDFSDAKNNNLDIARIYMSDAVAGGKTNIEAAVDAGILQIKGEIAPPRGQPGWASSILPLGAEGAAEDASQFDGIRLKVKIHSGNMTISANSTEITNFDYHTAPVVVPVDGKFHEVKIPFTSLKRAWSEQTPLNAATLNSLSIVAFDLKQSAFNFEIDEVGFY